jgi:glycosyltransferase involved in cell wall biosynthesis
MDTQTLFEKKVLIIAYGFPPIAHAGVYRTLRFCQYLPDNGWKPTVVTINESKDIYSDHSLLKRVPEDVRVHRTYIIDMWRVIRRHLAQEAQRNAARAAQGHAEHRGGPARAVQRAKKLFLSILLKLFSIPDHMLFWVPFAVIKGARLMRREDFDVIYTSSPPHSEHLAGLLLSKIFRTPWVADFRDPIVDNFNTQDLLGVELWLHGALERLIVGTADIVIAVTEHHGEALKKRYPAHSSKIMVIRNGFDPALFENVEAHRFDKLTILFTGTLYGTITPDFFIRGLAQWLDARDRVVRENIQALFYGMGCEKAGALARELGIDDVVKTSGLIPQEEIIRKQKGADLLLLIIGSDSRSPGIITSKLYEYMAVKRPILAIVPQGEALEILRDYGNFSHVPHEDYALLMKSLDDAYERYLQEGRTGPEQAQSTGFDNSKFDATNQVKDLIDVFNEAHLVKSAAPRERSLP